VGPDDQPRAGGNTTSRVAPPLRRVRRFGRSAFLGTNGVRATSLRRRSATALRATGSGLFPPPAPEPSRVQLHCASGVFSYIARTTVATARSTLGPRSMLSRFARRFGQPHRSNGASATLCGSYELQRQCVDGVPLQFFARRGHRCFPDVQQQPQPSLDVFSPIVVAATEGAFQSTTQNPGLHLPTRSVTASGRRLSAPRRGRGTGSRAETGRRRHLPRRPPPSGRGRGLQVKPSPFCCRL